MSTDDQHEALTTAEQIQAGAAAQAGKLAAVADEMIAESRRTRGLMEQQVVLFKQQVRNSGLNPLFVKAVAAALVLLLVGVTSLTVLVLQGRHRSKESLKISKSNQQVLAKVDQVLALVQSCTTPTGECARRGQSSQARAITQIVEQFSKIDGAYSLIVDQCAHEAPNAVVACFHAKAREAGLEK